MNECGVLIELPMNFPLPAQPPIEPNGVARPRRARDAGRRQRQRRRIAPQAPPARPARPHHPATLSRL